jgi:hypothetical protein
VVEQGARVEVQAWQESLERDLDCVFFLQISPMHKITKTDNTALQASGGARGSCECELLMSHLPFVLLSPTYPKIFSHHNVTVA